MSAAIAVRSLSVTRAGRTILDAISFDVSAGEFVALLGLNGAGKSTLLETVAGVLPGYTGVCEAAGAEVRTMERRELSRRLSFLPQTSGAQPGFAARQVVAMGRFPYTSGWMESPEDAFAVDRAMEACHCAHLAHRRLDQLSGGERQRVLLASALAQETPILALDEPSAHADASVQAAIFALLAKRAAEGTAVLAAVHDLNLALTFATRAVVLSDARIAFDGAVADFVRSHGFTQVFGATLAVRDLSGEPVVAYRRLA
jgi:iron complex transport system ATP-binding protein